MAFPIRTCVICEEEFELRPDKPGFANRCPACSTPEAEQERAQRAAGGDLKATMKSTPPAGTPIRDLLYRKDS